MSSEINIEVEFRAKANRKLSHASAQEVGPEIHSLMQGADAERLKPVEYLDWAQGHPDSASYKLFNWDDGDAARKWRIHEARNIINSIEIKIVDNRGSEQFVPAFPNVTIRVSDDNEAARVYTTFERVLGDPEATQRVVDGAMRDFKSWRNRYRTFRNLLPLARVYDATDDLVEGTDED
jgi:hypothetical protein